MAVIVARVVDSLAIPASSTLYSQAVSMQGANAVQVSFLVYTLGGSANVTAYLEGSNDMVNWTSTAIATFSAISSAGFAVPSVSSGSTSGIAWQYLRLKLTAAAGGTAIISADISTAQL